MAHRPGLSKSSEFDATVQHCYLRIQALGFTVFRNTMARLQRKKPSIGKKKKKQKDSAQISAGSDAGKGAKTTALTSASAVKARKQKAYVSKRGPAQPGKIVGYWNQSIQFLREVKVELKKVTWPSRKQTMGSTAVVLILVMIISFFLGVADIGLSSLIRVVLQ